MRYLRQIRPGLLASVAALVVMVAMSVRAYGQLPERVPIHWNAAGEVDDWGSRTAAAVMLPLIMLFTTSMLALAPLMEPDQARFERSRTTFHAAWIGTAVLLAAIHGAMLITAATGQTGFPLARLVEILVGGLFLAIGLAIGVGAARTGRGVATGIRTLRTFSGGVSSVRTERLAGRLFMVLGVVTIISGLLVPLELATWIMLAGMAVVVVVLLVASYRDSRRGTEGDHSGINEH